MTKTYNDALEWAAQWIEDTLRNGPETNERTIEFGTNMAMTLRAAKLTDADLPRAVADDQPKEDFERPYFCAVRALRHLKNKNHEFIPLECDGCKEVALFLTEPGYRGDEHNPIGADCERSY